MAQPKGHQPQHSTDHHLTPKVRVRNTTVKKKSNKAAARGTGMKMKGGTGMKGDYS